MKGWRNHKAGLGAGGKGTEAQEGSGWGADRGLSEGRARSRATAPPAAPGPPPAAGAPRGLRGGKAPPQPHRAQVEEAGRGVSEYRRGWALRSLLGQHPQRPKEVCVQLQPPEGHSMAPNSTAPPRSCAPPRPAAPPLPSASRPAAPGCCSCPCPCPAPALILP